MKGTTTGEASRRDANGSGDRHSLQDAIQQLENEHTARLARKRELEFELMALGNRFRAGERFGAGEYQKILDRQHDIKVALKDIEEQNRGAKLRKKALYDDLYALKGHGASSGDATNALLGKILAELKVIRRLMATSTHRERTDDR